jgi:hypothetical protein
MTNEIRREPPSWFLLAAIATLLWELIGCSMYLMQVSVDPARLPSDQRAIWEAAPTWMIGAYGLAVWSGLAGAILLLLKRRAAAPVLLVSLIAVIAQNSALLLVPEMRNLMTSDVLLMPFVIIVVCFVIWQFAHKAKQAGWLR